MLSQALNFSGNRSELVLRLFRANIVAAQCRWRLHRDQSYELQQVVLQNIVDGPEVCVPPRRQQDVFSHSDLHQFDVLVVPQWLKHRVRKRKAKIFCTVSLPR